MVERFRAAMVRIAVVGEGHLADATRAGVAAHFGLPCPLAMADLVWFCVDTPVDSEDRPNVEAVYARLVPTLAEIDPGTPVLISSQLPVGTNAKWEQLFPDHVLIVQPENIRKLSAEADFKNQARMVVGIRARANRDLVSMLIPVLNKFTDDILFMSPESAEMTKHALNAFLAMEITYANEIRDVCKLVGADVEDVFRGFRSDLRVGFLGPLMPGDPYRGGTLGRDVRVLIEMSFDQVVAPVIHAIHQSNASRL